MTTRMNQPSCYSCDDLGGGLYKPHEDETVWYMGLDVNGQAHFSCEDCKNGLFNVCRDYFGEAS